MLIDKKAELKKLNRSISICFLELLDILIDNPASSAVSLVSPGFVAAIIVYFTEEPEDQRSN